MALIKRNKENFITIRTLDNKGKLIIYPGINDIDESTPILLATPGKEGPKTGTIAEHPLYVELLETGVHTRIVAKVAKVVVDTSEEGASKKEIISSSTSDIVKMNSSDAQKIIKEILSIAQLEKIKIDEVTSGKSRKSVLDAIDAQIADIKSEPENKEKKD